MAGSLCMELMRPLCERPATKTTTLAKLLSWRAEAQARAASVSFTELDGGPDSEELLMEIEWYLDDAVASCTLHNNRSVSGWRQLRSSLTPGETSNDNQVVLLRSSLDELRDGWSQRIDHRRPFQYLVGCAHWRDLVLGVQEGVLIPRPETEQLIDLAGGALEGNRELKRGVWVDLGTGSGAIAIGIARALCDGGSVIAVDASDVAIGVARENVRRYKLEDKVTVVKGSWFSPLQEKVGGISGVVSNPPYIPSRNMAKLQAEVGRHEPASALDGGVKGSDHLEEICDGASWALKPGGFLALETDGGEQAHDIASYLSTKPFEDIKVVKDFADIERFVTAFRSKLSY